MRVLVLTHRLPYAPNRGDRIRAFHLLKLLAATHEVHLVSLVHDDEEGSHLGELDYLASVRGARVRSRLAGIAAAAWALPGERPLTHVMLDSPELPSILTEAARAAIPDVVLAYCTGMAPHALTPPLDSIPCVLDMVDVDSQKWAALAHTAGVPMRWVYAREARLLSAFERHALRNVAATTVVSERERELAHRVLGDPAPIVVSNGVDVHWFSPREPRPRSAEVIFCGVFNYAPNEEGALWLATDVWPRVRREVPDAVLKLVGMNPSKRVQALAVPGSIDVTGAVPDVRPHLWRAAVAVAPLRVARGVQNKVLEAVAAGLPCVVTSAVFAGLPSGIRPATASCDDAQAFAAATVRLLRASARERAEIAGAADVASYSWNAQLAPFLSILPEAVHRPSSVST